MEKEKTDRENVKSLALSIKEMLLLKSRLDFYG